MLKYFKRQKSQRSVEDANNVAGGTDKRHSLLSTSSFCDDILAEEEDDKSLQSFSDATNIEEIFNCSSRLSMSIRDILRDSECITLFVQYLEAKSALPLIKFYLDVENFRIAALGQLEKQQQQQEQQQPTSSSNQCEIENEAFNDLNTVVVANGCLRENTTQTANNVPELKTLCDLSMHKPLTDDEKSQIYAETNKQITKCTSNVGAGLLPKKARSQISLLSEQSIDIAHACVPAASVKDAIAIFQKYLCPNALHYVELPVNIISNLSLLLCKRQDEQQESTEEESSALSISADCFDEAQQFVLHELERLYLTDFLQSPFYCKFCLELINDEKRAQQLTIYDVLYSEVTLFFFMEFLEQHNERECLDFWTSAINFRKSYTNIKLDDLSTKEIQADAMIIYKKFFSLQAEGRLWLSDKLRCRVEAAICAAPEEVPHCFDLAIVVTAKYLQKKYFGAFVKSELFAQYTNELRTKLQESQHYGDSNEHELEENYGTDVLDAQTTKTILQHKLSFKGSKQSSTKRRHRKTLSDCSNEAIRQGELYKHISQQNTLLAMQDNNSSISTMQFKNLPNSSTSMSIDARQLTNPNLLWHRRYSTGNGAVDGGGLKFGRINSLGRYERDFESVEAFVGVGKHNNWSLGMSGTKIKNAMRKLVNLPEHKAQEEIAWQIAEMIVRDVTSITLKNSPLEKQAAVHADATNVAGNNMQTS